MRTALIVEPDQQSAKLVAVVLQKAGFQTHAVGSAEDAMRMLGTSRFNVVITELGLPVMTGLMLIATIRETPRLRETPIVVVTSNHDHEIKRRARAVGCDKFTSKPIDTASFDTQVCELLAELARLANGEQSA